MSKMRKKPTRTKGAFTLEEKRQMIGLLTESGEIQELNRRLGNKSLNMGHQPWLRSDNKSKYDATIPPVINEILEARRKRIEAERDAFVRTMMAIPWFRKRVEEGTVGLLGAAK